MEEYNCAICPRSCRAYRTQAGNNGGYCGMPAQPVVARAALHFGEEPCISGTRGSGTVFFTGCSLRCRFCQNDSISRGNVGKPVTVARLAEMFHELEAAGAHNINLVNPTHFAIEIRKALEIYKPSIPVLYNSSGYERFETLRSLDGLIDIYLPDCKYVHEELSADLSGAADYFHYAQMAIPEMIRQTGPVILDDDNMMKKGTMVRHLVLPGHTKESMAVLDWLARYKEIVWVSLMFQYTPMGDIADRKELQRRLTHRECEKVWAYMDALGIRNGYVQSLESSGAEMIPQFDLTGV